MIKRLRHFSGKHLIAFGIRVYGHDNVPTETVHEVKETLAIPEDAAVEAEIDTEAQWSPEQHGNVIIVEPPMMNKYRRGKL